MNQLMTDISRAGQKSDIHMRCYASGNDGIIVIEDYSEKKSFLEIEARVAGPRRQSRTLELKQVGPHRYTGSFPLWGRGLYQVTAIGAAEDRSERALSGFAVPYSPEYLRFRSNPFVLEEIARRTGGRMLTGDETGQEVFGKDRKPKDSSRPIFDWFLVLLAILIPLDVGVRRIQVELKMILGLFGLGRRKADSGKTLGALLQVKKGIKFAQSDGKEVVDLKTSPADRVPVSGGKKAVGDTIRNRVPVEKRPEKQEKPPGGLSTTGRLLEMKKKWKEKDPGQS